MAVDILFTGFFVVIALFGPIFHRLGPWGKLVAGLAAIFDVEFLAILISDGGGITFASLGVSYVIPNTFTATSGFVFPVAYLLPFILLFIDGAAIAT